MQATEGLAPDVMAIAEVRAGRTEAFRVLVERHSRPLFRLAYRLTRNESDADDIVQETFMRAYRSLDSFDARASFGTWLYRIATNAALDMMRRRKRDEAEPIADDDVVAAPSHSEGLPFRDALDRGMRSLSGNERTAFVLRHFEGRSIDEISEVLGTQVSATKNTIFRAVKKLREVLS